MQLVSLRKYSSEPQADGFTFGRKSKREGWKQVMVAQPQGLALSHRY